MAKDYAEKAGVKGYVIRVSGGVDSGWFLHFVAMTGLKVFGNRNANSSTKDQVSRALEHIEFLKINFQMWKVFSVDLNEPFKPYTKLLM